MSMAFATGSSQAPAGACDGQGTRMDTRRQGRPFRFFDNRQKYLLFVTTTTEKREVAERAGLEIAELAPVLPALSVFDAGMGDGRSSPRSAG